MHDVSKNTHTYAQDVRRSQRACCSSIELEHETGLTETGFWLISVGKFPALLPLCSPFTSAWYQLKGNKNTALLREYPTGPASSVSSNPSLFCF